MKELTDFLSKEDQEYHHIHEARFKQSLECLSQYIKPEHDILEVGGEPGIFTRILRENLTFKSLLNTHTDLRQPIEYGDNMFDVVILMEVIEHINDVDPSIYHSSWQGNGTTFILEECYRVLKPGGILFLTTPNCNSIKSLKQMLEYKHPYIYWHHSREISVNDLRWYLAETKFSIEIFETKDSWYYLSGNDFKIVEAMKTLGYSTKDRGDNTFVVARK